jgi:hypothetical protein
LSSIHRILSNTICPMVNLAFIGTWKLSFYVITNYFEPHRGGIMLTVNSHLDKGKILVKTSSKSIIVILNNVVVCLKEHMYNVKNKFDYLNKC